MSTTSANLIKRFQIIFLASSVLLVISICFSYYTIQKLIFHSGWVNHTNEVLFETQTLNGIIKDAEAGHRGYLLTLNPIYLDTYTGAFSKTLASSERIGNLTKDNKVQQQNVAELNNLIAERFRQFESVLNLAELDAGSIRKNTELQKGKLIMTSLETVLRRIRNEEQRLLKLREESQSGFVAYAPFTIIFSGLISIAITALAFIRIKKDVEERIRKQKEEQELYQRTGERISSAEIVASQVAAGDYEVRSHDTAEDELGRIGKALNNMITSLHANYLAEQKRNWLQQGSIALSAVIMGEKNVGPLTAKLLDSLSAYIGATVGNFYIVNNHYLKLSASYGTHNSPEILGENAGLAGQALSSGKITILADIPSSYLQVSSSLGQTSPVSVVIVPLHFGEEKLGILELGFIKPLLGEEIQLLESNRELISTGLNTALSYEKVQELLEETQSQSEELQAQHSELENVNSELEAQTEKLQSSEEELRVQQQELQQTNQDLEERTLMLQEKNHEINRKAEELALSTRYKSEFLANMSHELRTPLNSILLLSRLLSDNTENNLNTEQIEYAQVIRSSGNGLLNLIDEILDLSKIEAGKMELQVEDIEIRKITNELQALFSPVAREKGVSFLISIEQELPETFRSDEMRLQ
ncbi:MAG: CHASE3 domain-containing protein, partial [Bacteroidota bacterium]